MMPLFVARIFLTGRNNDGRRRKARRDPAALAGGRSRASDSRC
jgi:hypothetical protein